MMSDRARALMKVWRARGGDKVEAVREYVDRFRERDCIGELVPLFEYEPADVFWRCFSLVWPYFYSGHHWNERLYKAMLRVGPHESVMDLPERFTVYRGCLRSRIDGISWTCNPRTALLFAYVYPAWPDPVVACAQIAREEAFWCHSYSESRAFREAMVICRPKDWSLIANSRLDLDILDSKIVDPESEAIKPSVRHRVVVTPINEAARRPDSAGRHVELAGSRPSNF
jgi:hypothetical protein